MRWLLVSSLALLTACSMCRQEEPLPALIVDADVNAHRELAQLISAAVKQDEVALSPQMFEQSSIVVLSQPDLSALQLSPGPRFQLLKQGKRCLLKSLDSEATWRLSEVSCKIAE